MAEEKKYHYVIVKCDSQKMFDDIKNGALIPLFLKDNDKLAAVRQWQVIKKIKKTLELHVQPYDN